MLWELALLLMYIVIPILVYYDVIPVRFRWETFLGGALFTALIAYMLGFSLHDLGIRSDNFNQADGYYYIMFFLAFGVSAYFKQNHYTMGYKEHLGKQLSSFRGLYFVPAQEFIYRAVLYPVLLSLGVPQFWCIPTMALIFGWAHIPFHSKKIFWLTLGLGIMLSSIYVIFPNYMLVTILHGIVWVTALNFKII